MKTVFIPPIVNSSFLRQLPQQMASQFAKHGYKVYFCNERAGINLKKVEVEKNLTVYPNWEYFYHEFKTQNIKIDIMYNTAAKNYEYSDLVKPEYNIYHSCDSFQEWKNYEPHMLKRANIVLCNSEFIYNIRKNQHENVYLVRNGCNESYINMDYTIYNNLKFVKPPICVFSGACGVWVSTYLIKKTAEEYFTYFVGMSFGKAIPENVNFQPVLEHHEMMNFLNNMDVGLLPFNTKSEITQAANPIKLWEYLASGLPIVATDWNETNREELKNVVFPTNDKEEFLSNIQKIANMSDIDKKCLKEECFKIAKNNTWEIRFNVIEKQIREFFN